MKRLLCILGELNAGGAETYMMKLYRAVDREQYQFDFAVASETKGYYDDEILKLGGRIHRITPKKKGLIKNLKSVYRIVRDERYDAVLRLSQHSLSALELLAARLAGARTLAYRSSSTCAPGGKASRLLHRMYRFLPVLVPNVKLAPSIDAGIFMFGKRSVKKGKVLVLNNALDIKRYTFRYDTREVYRKKYGLEDKFVIGHIGAFRSQKNQMFLLDVLVSLKKIRQDIRLLLIGDGEHLDDCRAYAARLGLTESVRFTGIRADVPELLMAMDVFVFPSLYEGMPNTVIEAQATGLRCIASDSITRDVNITGAVDFLSLDVGPSFWARHISMLQFPYDRRDWMDVFRDSGYDISDAVTVFTQAIFERG